MGRMKGFKHSKETRRKISKANKGKHNYMFGKRFKHTEKAKEKMRKKRPNMTGKNHYNYKGRTKNRDGYIFIYSPNHPNVINKRYKQIYEHRLVMEKYLGRYLKPREIVHHINGIRDDNRLENLILFPNTSAHHKFKHLGKKTFICKYCGKNQLKEEK